MKRSNSPSSSQVAINHHEHGVNANGLFDLAVIRQQRRQLGGQIHGGTQDDPILL